jgi:drug/metabolite transporter (DMT)-like permease
MTAPTAAPASLMPPREWAVLLALSVLWGGSFLFIKVAAAEIPPLTLVLLRVSLAAAALLGAMRLLGLRLPLGRGALAAFAVMALLNNVVPFTLIVWGTARIDAGLAAILNAATPLSTAVAAHLLTRDEKLSMAKAAGVGIGLCGVAAIVGVEALGGLGGDVAAQAAIVLATVSYGFAAIFGRRFRRMGVAPTATAAGQLAASTLLLLPAALVLDRPWTLPAPSAEAVGSVLGLALLSTALAYVLYFRVLAAAGATAASLVTLMIPASALLMGAALLGERPGALDLLGLGLIAAGLLVADGRIRLPRRAARQ